MLSWPPWAFWLLVKPEAILPASLPSAHSGPAESRNCLSWAATFPNRVGEPKT